MIMETTIRAKLIRGKRTGRLIPERNPDVQPPKCTCINDEQKELCQCESVEFWQFDKVRKGIDDILDVLPDIIADEIDVLIDSVGGPGNDYLRPYLYDGAWKQIESSWRKIARP
jgi:hypothetical protein